MTMTFIQSHSCMRKQKLWCPFSCKFQYQFEWNLVCCHNLLVFWSLCSIFFTASSQGGALCWWDFMKYTFNIVMCQDICERICFKLGVMLNAKHNSSLQLIPVWMTLSSHKVSWLQVYSWFQFEWPYLHARSHGYRSTVDSSLNDHIFTQGLMVTGLQLIPVWMTISSHKVSWLWESWTCAIILL